MSDDLYETWEQDGKVLAQIGRHLFEQRLLVSVRLPRTLADAAVSAWNREESDGDVADETPKQRTVRHQAGALGLIGLSVEQSGSENGAEVVVEIDAWQIGNALDAADAAGLLSGLRPPPP